MMATKHEASVLRCSFWPGWVEFSSESYTPNKG